MKSWPHCSQTWLRSPCLPCPGTLGFHKTPLAMMATTWHLLGSRKKVPFFLFPRKPPQAVGERALPSRLWSVVTQGFKVSNWGWAPNCKVIVVSGNLFLLLQKHRLFWGVGGCPLWEKKTEGQLVVVNVLERSLHEKALLGKILALCYCQGYWRLGYLLQES